MRTLTSLLIAVAAFALIGCGKTPAVHPTVTAAEMATWPRTVDQAVTNIVAGMSTEDKQKVRATK